MWSIIIGLFGILILSLIIFGSVEGANAVKQPKFAVFSQNLGRKDWMSLDKNYPSSFIRPNPPVISDDHIITFGGKILQPLLGVTGVIQCFVDGNYF